MSKTKESKQPKLSIKSNLVLLNLKKYFIKKYAKVEFNEEVLDAHTVRLIAIIPRVYKKEEVLESLYRFITQIVKLNPLLSVIPVVRYKLLEINNDYIRRINKTTGDTIEIAGRPIIASNAHQGRRSTYE